MKRHTFNRENSAAVEQPALLNQAGADSQQEEQQRRIYRILTNRNNLLNILSSGWIMPAACYENYYDDPGQFARDGVVLLVNVPSDEMCSQMVGDDPAVFPVVLEIDLKGMTGDVALVDANGVTSAASLTSVEYTERAVAVVCSGILPVSRVVAVHFRSASDLQEHRLREYENVPVDEIPMVVSPEVFQGPSVDVERVRQGLQDSEGILAPVSLELIRRAGSLAGALVMLAAAMRAVSGLPLSLLALPLNPSRRPGARQKDSAIDGAQQDNLLLQRCIAVFPRFLQLEGGKKRRQQGRNERLRTISPDLVEPPGSQDTAASLLFFIACESLAETDSKEYYNQESLHRIRGRFERAIMVALPADEGGRVLGRYFEWLDSMQAILANTMDIAEFPADADLVCDGLLRFLQRSSPARAITWADETPHLRDQTVAVAAMFAGMLHRRERIPVEIRPETKLVRSVDERICWMVNGLISGLQPSEPQSDPVVEELSTDRGRARVLKWNGEIIMSQRTDPSRGRAQRPGENSSDIPGVRDDARGPSGLPGNAGGAGLAEQVKNAFLGGDLKQPQLLEAAINMCRSAAWTDCLTTIFNLDRPDLFLRATPDNRGIELRIPGIIKPTSLDLREREFRSRLMTTGVNDVGDDVLREVALTLGFAE